MARVNMQKFQYVISGEKPLENIKKLQKEGLSEDAGKDAEAEVQVLTDKHIALVEKHLAC
jgi:ribosome recycling factor